jgi:hypothetical protein
MLRIFGFLSAVTIMFFCFSEKASADEYGERFYNNTPAGMAEYTVPPHETQDIAMDDMATDLQDIKPAAGEEAAKSDPEVIEAADQEQDTATE